MPSFDYHARDTMGVAVRGRMEASSRDDLVGALQSKGLTLVRARPCRPATRRARGRLPARRLPSILRDLATIDESGVPLLGGLGDLLDDGARGPTVAALRHLRDSVQQGQTLAEAMAERPGVFPRPVVAATHVGERSGTLAATLSRMADHLEWKHRVSSQARQVLIYPVILAGALTGLTVMILAVLIPRLSRIFQQIDTELPAPTRAVMAASDFLTRFWPLLVGAAVVAVVSVIALRLTEKGRVCWDRLLLHLPVAGPILRRIQAGQVCSSLSTLVNAGLPLTEAMEITGEVTSNRHVARRVLQSREEVTRGSSLSESLGRQKVLPPLVRRMVNLGESTGTLDQSLQRVVRLFDREVPELVKRLVSFVEPATILIGGVVVGFIVVSALLPLFRLMRSI